MEEKPVEIVLVDDHTVVRSGIKSLINTLGNFNVAAQFDNGLELIQCIGETCPSWDIIIIDLNMPVLNGLETTRWLRKKYPNLKILILTLESDEKVILELFRLGIRGYLPKSCSAALLKKAIIDIYSTGYYHSELLMQALLTTEERNSKRDELLSLLSARDIEFIKLCGNKEEYTYEKISELMGMSIRTIDGIRNKLFEKLQIKSKIGLVMFAIKHGLINIE